MNSIAVVLFVYDRPEPTRRSLNAIREAVAATTGTTLFVVQDGIMDPFVHTPKAVSQQGHSAVRDIVLRIGGLSERRFIRFEYNRGIGLVQNLTLRLLFDMADFDAVIWVEDDVVVAPDTLKIVAELLTISDTYKEIGLVGANYRNHESTCPIVLDDLWGRAQWCCGMTRTKYARIKDKYNAVCYRAYGHLTSYAEKNIYPNRIAVYASAAAEGLDLDIMPLVLSQDMMRLRCFSFAGMKYMLYPSRRTVLPIGQVGSHSTTETWNEDSTTMDYIDNAADIASQLNAWVQRVGDEVRHALNVRSGMAIPEEDECAVISGSLERLDKVCVPLVKTFFPFELSEKWQWRVYDDLWRTLQDAPLEDIDAIIQQTAESTVKHLYLSALNRSADPGGLCHLSKRLAAGQGSAARAFRDMRFSKEGLNRAVSLGRFIGSAERSGFHTQSPVIKVVYIGCVGTSGYANAAASIVQALSHHARISVHFVPYLDQDVTDDVTQEGYAVTQAHQNRVRDADVIIAHTQPGTWADLVNYYRCCHPRALVYGITVWEADKLPLEWYDGFAAVDVVSFPNTINKAALEPSGIRATTLLHPVQVVTGAAATTADGPYVFYVIGKYNERKNILSTIRAYLRAFTSADNVLFKVKTSADYDVDVVAEVNSLRSTFPDPPPLELHVGTITNTELHQLHHEAHCFFSLSRSEGQGLGACEAASIGKPIIMTGYGAQTEYISGKNVHWVDYTMVPAVWCSGRHAGAKQCAEQQWCTFNPFYHWDYMKWAEPDMDHAVTLLRQAYEERWVDGSILTPECSLERVGDALESDLRQMIMNA